MIQKRTIAHKTFHMNIKLRSSELKDGRISLYLDFYVPHEKKKRYKEYLKLYIHKNPTNSQEKQHNKKINLLAESIRSKKLLELQHSSKGFKHLVSKEKDVFFLDYFDQMAEDKYTSAGNYSIWISAKKHLHAFAPKDIKLREITTEWLEDFKSYMQNKAKTKSNKPLSQNSLYSYFNKVKACLNEAYRTKLIDENPVQDVKGFKQGDTERQFLTLEELKRVAKEECEIPILKTAFLFGCLTGLRWSDINKLTWKEVQFSEYSGWMIRFQQQKTKQQESLPISEQAREYLGEPGEPDERVFVGLKYSAWHNLKLQQWMMKAGISKTITFHCARHTYATLQLTLGTDIYTVSKLLGHKDLKTTQVYAKIIDQKKKEAANIIPDLGI